MSAAEDIERQAAAWIARLDRAGEGCDAGLAAWLTADPRHRVAYLRLQEAWRRSQRLEGLRPADDPIDPDLLAPVRPSGWKSRLRHRRGIRLAATPSSSTAHRRAPRALGWSAAAMALVAGALALWWTLAQPPTQIFRTGEGGLYRVVLADGSSVILNADTDVRVHYTAARRSISLVRGEAQFIVVHDAQRPFEVRAKGHIVRDLGTHFDVRLGAGPAFDVLVTRGRVAVMPANEVTAPFESTGQASISAGELALVGATRVTAHPLDPGKIADRLAWKHRQLQFRGETLGQAVAEFNRHNSMKLVIKSPSIESLRIGGNFDAIDTGSFVAALSRSFGISARGSNGVTYLSGPVAR